MVSNPVIPTNTLLAQCICNYLNDLLVSDRAAVAALFSSRSTCNETLANHPTCEVIMQNGGFHVNFLGILNGLLRGDEPCNGPIEMFFKEAEVVPEGADPKKYWRDLAGFRLTECCQKNKDKAALHDGNMMWTEYWGNYLNAEEQSENENMIPATGISTDGGLTHGTSGPLKLIGGMVTLQVQLQSACSFHPEVCHVTMPYVVIDLKKELSTDIEVCQLSDRDKISITFPASSWSIGKDEREFMEKVRNLKCVEKILSVNTSPLPETGLPNVDPPRRSLPTDHEAFGDCQKLHDEDILQKGDQTAVISNLLSANGAGWVDIPRDMFGKTCLEVIKNDTDIHGWERVFRRSAPISTKNVLVTVSRTADLDAVVKNLISAGLAVVDVFKNSNVVSGTVYESKMFELEKVDGVTSVECDPEVSATGSHKNGVAK